jgi:hypothetical protein
MVTVGSLHWVRGKPSVHPGMRGKPTVHPSVVEKLSQYQHHHPMIVIIGSELTSLTPPTRAPLALPTPQTTDTGITSGPLS